MNPYAVQVMDEIGVECEACLVYISGQYSKSVRDMDISRMDTIITLCADEICLLHQDMCSICIGPSPTRLATTQMPLRRAVWRSFALHEMKLVQKLPILCEKHGFDP